MIKKILTLMIGLLVVLVPLFSGCGPDSNKDNTPTPTPNITDVINDIQPDEINLDAAMNATLPGGGTLDDLIDKSLLETSETPNP
jgi:hypothetical protein